MKLIDYVFLIITMWCFLTLCSCLLPCCILLTGKDDYPAKLGSGSTSSTRRFEKRTPGCLGSIGPLPKSGKGIALQRANAYKSQHPFSVIVAMKPSYITGYILVSFLYTTMLAGWAITNSFTYISGTIISVLSL